jgi:hypothetical protein
MSASGKQAAVWPCRGRFLALVFTCLVAAQTAHAQWVPNESLASSQRDLIDPEYNHARGQFCWISEDGKLWVGGIDRGTGLFYPPDGKGILVDPDTMATADFKIAGNGPEWVWSADGDDIAYTKFKGRRHSNATARLGYARPLPDGTWSAGFLGPDIPRKGPLGSETAGDPRPRITYLDNNGDWHWRYVDDPSSEQLIANVHSTDGPVRHVRGNLAIVYRTLAGSVNQAFYQDLSSGQVTQLTFDSGDKDVVWMWPAPEFANDLVLMVLVDNNEIRIYRNLPDPGTGTLRWTVIYSVKAAHGNGFKSPEPFVYANRSYVFIAQSVDSHNYTSEVLVSNIDATAPLVRRVTDNTLLRARTDPEVFVTDSGVFLYYNRHTIDAQGKMCRSLECSEGIYRADTGLTP